MNILVLRFSSLGDLIKVTALLERIHQEIPEAKVHFVTKEQFKDLFIEDKRIHSLYLLSKTNSEKKIIDDLKKFEFDLLIDAHSNLRTFFFKRALKEKTKKILFLHKSRLRKILLFVFRIPSPPYFLDRRCFELLDKVLKTRNKTYYPKLNLNLPQIKKNIESKINIDYSKTIIFIPGAAWPNKELSLKSWHEIRQKFGSDYNFIALGGPERKFTIDGVIDCSGKFSIVESLVIGSLSKYVIGVDTGVTHGIEALDKDVTILLGPTSLETGAYPSRPHSKIVERDIFCRPCSKNGSAPCIWGLGSKRCLNLDIDEIHKETLERF